jgi:hypothetical protein
VFTIQLRSRTPLLGFSLARHVARREAVCDGGVREFEGSIAGRIRPEENELQSFASEMGAARGA